MKSTKFRSRKFRKQSIPIPICILEWVFLIWANAKVFSFQFERWLQDMPIPLTYAFWIAYFLLTIHAALTIVARHKKWRSYLAITTLNICCFAFLDTLQMCTSNYKGDAILRRISIWAIFISITMLLILTKKPLFKKESPKLLRILDPCDLIIIRLNIYPIVSLLLVALGLLTYGKLTYFSSSVETKTVERMSKEFRVDEELLLYKPYVPEKWDQIIKSFPAITLGVDKFNITMVEKKITRNDAMSLIESLQNQTGKPYMFYEVFVSDGLCSDIILWNKIMTFYCLSLIAYNPENKVLCNRAISCLDIIIKAYPLDSAPFLWYKFHLMEAIILNIERHEYKEKMRHIIYQNLRQQDWTLVILKQLNRLNEIHRRKAFPHQERDGLVTYKRSSIKDWFCVKFGYAYVAKCHLVAYQKSKEKDFDPSTIFVTSPTCTDAEKELMEKLEVESFWTEIAKKHQNLLALVSKN